MAAIQAEEAAAAQEASDKRARQQQELQYRSALGSHACLTCSAGVSQMQYGMAAEKAACQ